MRVAAYKSVGLVNFGIARSELESLLGAPEKERKSHIFALELRYRAGAYRFNSDGMLKEITVDAPELEIEGECVSFESLRLFLVKCDKELFECVGFLVSPKFGLAFDPEFPSWVTAFTLDVLQLWRSIEINK